MISGANFSAVFQCSVSPLRTWLKAIDGMPSKAASRAAATVPE